MVKVYLADISKIADPSEASELLGQLPVDRIKKISKMRQEKSRRQSLGAGLLLNRVLGYYGVEPTSVTVGAHGKPEVDGICFNLSHSGELVVCAVSENPIGCDVENLREAPKGVAERFFSESEKKYLEQFFGHAYDEAFFRLWTMKESYVKMTGEGMGLPEGTYELLVGEQAKVRRDGKIQDCHMSEVVAQDYIISICAESSAHVEIIWESL